MVGFSDRLLDCFKISASPPGRGQPTYLNDFVIRRWQPPNSALSGPESTTSREEGTCWAKFRKDPAPRERRPSASTQTQLAEAGQKQGNPNVSSWRSADRLMSGLADGCPQQLSHKSSRQMITSNILIVVVAIVSVLVLIVLNPAPTGQATSWNRRT